MFFMILVFLFYKRFVNSPTGRVCIANRENENRTTMLGYNTFWFKLTALIISSVTAGLAGSLHALFHPIIRPDIAGLSFTIAALLMILIGGVGTLSGALIGAAVFRLLSFGLDRYMGGSSRIIIGLVYIGIVLYLPYGIVGTWKQKTLNIKEGRDRLLSYFTGRSSNDEIKEE
jgi:branched-chain amino acid transport system permease protein